MNEKEGYLIEAIKDKVCRVRFYSTNFNHDDLFNALNFCGFYPPGFDLEERLISASDKPVLEDIPIKGDVADIWVVKDSIRVDGNGTVKSPK
jgi:hypothetical protein